MSESNKFLFVVDLDGTVLSDSFTSAIHPTTKQAIERASSEGHVVAIATGRPWSATKNIYKELNLKTIVANNNGAHIHNPFDEEFIPVVKNINLNELMYIFGDLKLKKASNNYAIQGTDWVQIQHHNPILEVMFGYGSIKKFKLGIDLNKLPIQPTSAVIDLKPDIDEVKLISYLRQRYGDLAEFSAWSKGEGQTPVLEISALGVNKNKVVPLLARYYHIKMKNIVTIGDAYNDIGMLDVGTISVAMKNATKDVKQHANYTTHFTNLEGGVGHFINLILDNEKALLRKLKHVNKSIEEIG